MKLVLLPNDQQTADLLEFSSGWGRLKQTPAWLLLWAEDEKLINDSRAKVLPSLRKAASRMPQPIRNALGAPRANAATLYDAVEDFIGRELPEFLRTGGL